MSFRVNPLTFRQIQQAKWVLETPTTLTYYFRQHYIIKEFIQNYLLYQNIKIVNYSGKAHIKKTWI